VNLHARLAARRTSTSRCCFRDWLRAHPAGVGGLGRARERARGRRGPAEYTEIKDRVVDLVLAAAEPRARATGWTP
jgi:GrpB-like predicted nucleotidyltransferase (UPF0157 family)